jgi:hypothetical protein
LDGLRFSLLLSRLGLHLRELEERLTRERAFELLQELRASRRSRAHFRAARTKPHSKAGSR